MVVLRPLYTELPYAAVLDTEWIYDRCAYCFSETFTPCPSRCNGAVYCGQACVEADRPYHQFECDSLIAKKSNPSGDPNSATTTTQDEELEKTIDRLAGPVIPDTNLRLMGRIAARLRLDGGVCQSLAEGLPASVKRRSFWKLKPLSRSVRKTYDLQSCVDQFVEFFSPTAIGSMNRKQLRRVLCIVVRNKSLVKSQPPSRFKCLASGQAIYLYQPQFKHSCRPDLQIRLLDTGRWRIQVNTIVRSGDSNTIDPWKRFDRLTTDLNTYRGCGNGTYVYYNRDETDSVWYGTDVTCHCAKCRDPVAVYFQENASRVECDHCGRPYVWIEDTAAMKTTCKCSKGRKRLPGDREKIQRDLALLTLESVEAACRGITAEPSRLMIVYEPVLTLARKYWHPQANLRFGRAYQQLFLAYKSIGQEAAWKRPGSIVGLRVALAESGMNMGEAMLATYEYHQCLEDYELVWLHVYMVLVHFCFIVNERNRLVHWLSKMRTTLQINGDQKATEVAEKAITAARDNSTERKQLLSVILDLKRMLFSQART